MADSLEDRWISSLPQHIQEALDVIDESLNDFAGNVRIAETLGKIAFRRAIDAVAAQSRAEEGDYVETEDDLGPIGTTLIPDVEVNARMDIALRANREAARIKEQRVRMIDEFTEVTDMPKPANLNFHVIRSSKSEQAKKMRAIGLNKEAEALEVEEEEWDEEQA